MTFNMLFRLRENSEILGFILPYLGQNDASLPCPPPGLVSKKRVFNYPTDFNQMKKEDIEALSTRGEQLVNNLIETYYPEL